MLELKNEFDDENKIQVWHIVIPLWWLATEFGLLFYMRDSPILVCVQLIFNIEVIIGSTVYYMCDMLFMTFAVQRCISDFSIISKYF